MATTQFDQQPLTNDNSIGQLFKMAFPGYMVMRAVVFIVAIVAPMIAGFGWVFQTTLSGYDIAFSTMLSRMEALDGTVDQVSATVRELGGRVSIDNAQIKSDLSIIKQTVIGNAELIKGGRSNLDEIRNSLHENREKTARLSAVVEQFSYEKIRPAAGPEDHR